MGIDYNGARLLAFCKRAGVDFTSTVMIGRQTLDATPSEFRAIFGLTGLPLPGYSEPLFKALGAKSVDSVDVNDYEQATVMHDMNEPIPDRLRERYTFVVDGGALEHIFNFPVAIKNCMDMVAVGGHFVAGVPANNWSGHGFYQFSPELYYRVLSEPYGFQVREMFLATRIGRGKWLRVADPAVIRQRIPFSNCLETSLYVLARKIRTAPFSPTPQQSDYQMLSWQGSEPRADSRAFRQSLLAKGLLACLRRVPSGIVNGVKAARDHYRFLNRRLAPGLEKIEIERLPAR